MQSQRGSIGVNILLAITLIVIGILIYILAVPHKTQTVSTSGVVSPETVKTSAHQPRPRGYFSDGLGRPDAATEYSLDETGSGTASIQIFKRDINNDGRPDRIIKSRVENGTGHFYDEYKIELATNRGFSDITPADFRTIEGADCALQRFQFLFSPQFQIIKISRPWQESWDTPTRAIKTTYALRDDQIHEIESKNLKVICNVADLFD